MQLGEYKLITFRSEAAHQAKRKAVAYWYDHRLTLQLPLRAFLARCLPSRDGTALTFQGTELSPPDDEPSSYFVACSASPVAYC